MKFTFGVICRQDGMPRVMELYNSIAPQIPHENFEVIVVGDPDLRSYSPIANIRIIPFDETQKKSWITRKKNIITAHAKYDNIVYLHDYIVLDPGWYDGWLKFGENYSAAMNRIRNKDGSRFRDWVLWVDQPVIEALAKAGAGTHACLLPYEEKDLTKFQYFSGAYWVAKKSVMQEFPLNEALCWGDGEDVEWSIRVRNKYKLSINAESSVSLTREGKFATFYDIGPHYQTIKHMLIGGPNLNA